MNKNLFGTLPCGKDIYSYNIKNGDIELTVMERGATILSLKAFGTDIVGGFDSLADYLEDTSHQGAIIGRVANRVANAQFVMDGKTYNLPKNDGENCLHGGDGFDHRVWTLKDSGDNFLTFTYSAKDGEEGFPAGLDVTVTYTVSDNAVIIDYTAIPDGKTPIALTNHAYFNLDGFGGTIENHTATIYADSYTEVSDALIPNGIRPSVIGTAFDFTTPHKIGERTGGDFVGYDHNFILAPKNYARFLDKELGLAVFVEGEKLNMSVYTDQPGIQFYIGNFLGDGPDFKGGVKQVFHGAFCLETQTEPDCINHGIGFYEKGEVYKHTTAYKVGKK